MCQASAADPRSDVAGGRRGRGLLGTAQPGHAGDRHGVAGRGVERQVATLATHVHVEPGDVASVGPGRRSSRHREVGAAAASCPK